MKILLIFSALAICPALRAASAAAQSGTITGRVVITKALTKERVALPMYQLRGVSPEAQPKDLPKRRTGVDELSRVVIYLQGPGLGPGAPVRATLSQKGLRFHPEIIAVPAGSTISFPNEDPVFHNVFSLSKAKHFDLGYYPKGQTRIVRFNRPGVVQVYCHIHPDMSAAIVVVPTAWWARVKPDGSFSLKSIPPGTYELMAWHRSAGFFRKRVTVSSGKTLKADFIIPVEEAGSGEAIATWR